MVILDIMSDGQDGIEILKSIKEISPDSEVIMLSSDSEMEVAVRSFRNGDSDYVLKVMNHSRRSIYWSSKHSPTRYR